MSAADLPPWVEHGLCAQTDPESFFPPPGGSTTPAKETCARCPVRDMCLQYALDNDLRYGIWGGTTAKERLTIRRGSRKP